jgi:hypothetical protein
MRVALVKRDGATETPVELGEGAAADERLATLVTTHGAENVREEGAEPKKAEAKKPAARKRAPAKKPASKKRR